MKTYIVRLNGLALAKVTAKTAEEAIELVRAELGLTAVEKEADDIQWLI